MKRNGTKCVTFGCQGVLNEEKWNEMCHIWVPRGAE